jgi:hypothetical protein
MSNNLFSLVNYSAHPSATALRKGSTRFAPSNGSRTPLIRSMPATTRHVK